MNHLYFLFSKVLAYIRLLRTNSIKTLPVMSLLLCQSTYAQEELFSSNKPDQVPSRVNEKLNQLDETADFKSNHGDFTVVFPFELISFTATLNKSKVDLKWTTIHEKNLSHFVVEKSYDGKNFKDAAVVFSIENTSEKADYILPDKIENFQSGIIYYRLCFIYNDGKYTYSKVCTISIDPEHTSRSIVTYPNPFNNKLDITIPSKWQNKEVKVEVFSATGHPIKSKILISATQTITLLMDDLNRGIYYLKTICGSELAHQVIAKN